MTLLSALDDDLLHHCLSFLEWRDLLTCSATCHRCERSSSSNLLWQPLVQQLPLRPLDDSQALAVPEGAWRQIFKGWSCAWVLANASTRVSELRDLEKSCANRSRFLRHSVRSAVQRVEGVKTILREKQRQRDNLMAIDALARMDQVRALLLPGWYDVVAAGTCCEHSIRRAPQVDDARRRDWGIHRPRSPPPQSELDAAARALSEVEVHMRAADETLAKLKDNIRQGAAELTRLQQERSRLMEDEELAAEALAAVRATLPTLQASPLLPPPPSASAAHSTAGAGSSSAAAYELNMVLATTGGCAAASSTSSSCG